MKIRAMAIWRPDQMGPADAGACASRRKHIERREDRSQHLRSSAEEHLCARGKSVAMRQGTCRERDTSSPVARAHLCNHLSEI
jgi:hypothetical protein